MCGLPVVCGSGADKRCRARGTTAGHAQSRTAGPDPLGARRSYSHVGTSAPRGAGFGGEFPQRDQGVPNAGLHRPDRDTRFRCRFGLGVPAEVRQFECFPLRGREGFHGGCDTVVLDQGFGFFRDVVPADFEIAKPGEGVAVTGGLRGPDTVDRAAPGPDEQPRQSCAPGRVERRGFLPCGEEHLLCDLLGLRRVHQDPPNQAQDPRRRPVIEHRESAIVALCDESEEVLARPFSGDRQHRSKRHEKVRSEKPRG
ncbi:hypothetical protein EDF20_3128 [Frigoribacterium sp. PhB116]|nr:hypothetical protein EDF20_3128 [Frigoribacterium sp. PhB116]